MLQRHRNGPGSFQAVVMATLAADLKYFCLPISGNTAALNCALSYPTIASWQTIYRNVKLYGITTESLGGTLFLFLLFNVTGFVQLFYDSDKW